MARPVIIDTDPGIDDALAIMLARGERLDDAVRFASAVAAVSVRWIGAQASYVDRDEVEAFIADRG